MSHSLKLLFISLNLLLFSLIACKKDNDNDTSGASTGSSAHDILSADIYSTLTLEVNYMPGFKPEDAAINNLKSFLGALVNKPGGINVTFKEIAAQSGKSLSISDISGIEAANRSVLSTNTTKAIYILFTDGESASNSGNSKVLGVAYKSTSMAVFGKTIHDHSGGIGQVNRTTLESHVLAHEFGHLLGLVNVGTAMQTSHIDPAHGKHCKNSACLMYYKSETTDATGFLTGGTIPALDADCKADLKGNGGK